MCLHHSMDKCLNKTINSDVYIIENRFKLGYFHDHVEYFPGYYSHIKRISSLKVMKMARFKTKYGKSLAERERKAKTKKKKQKGEKNRNGKKN